MMWQGDWNSWGWGAWCLMFGTMLVIGGLAIWLVVALGRRNTTVRTERPGSSAGFPDQIQG